MFFFFLLNDRNSFTYTRLKESCRLLTVIKHCNFSDFFCNNGGMNRRAHEGRGMTDTEREAVLQTSALKVG